MIDLTRPFRLKRMIVDAKTGNVYPPISDRSYLPGEVPGRLLNDSNCEQENSYSIADTVMHFAEEEFPRKDASPLTPIKDTTPVTGFEGRNDPAKAIAPSDEYLEGTTKVQTLHPKTVETKKTNKAE